MKPGDYLSIGLCVAFVVIACAYAYSRDWPRAGYFLTAAALNVCVMLMR